MRKMKIWGLLAAAALLAAACDPLTATVQGKKVQGTYVLTTKSEYGSWTEKMTISDMTVKYESGSDETSLSTVYVGEIRKTVLNRFNGGETQLALNTEKETVWENFGYMVLRYTVCDNEGTGNPGSFNVFRFGQKEDGTWVFTQGYKNSSSEEGVYINRLFDEAAEAERQITLENGYFGFASAGYRKQ